MTDGRWQVGYGVAGVSYLWWQVRCQVRVTPPTAQRTCAAPNDIGTGTYIVMQQLADELLGLSQVRVTLGDSDLPWAPAAVGSGLTGALGNAVHLACKAVVERFDELGRETGEPYADLLARLGLTELTIDAESTPPDPGTLGMAPSGAFAAKFVEVRVDRDLGLIRIARIVSVVDGGRILNEKLARSQIIGGTVGHRPSDLRGDAHGRRHRADRERAARRLPHSRQRRRPGHRCRLRRRTGPHDPDGDEGDRRDRTGRDCAGHRQRRLSRDRAADPFPSDHDRPRPPAVKLRASLTAPSPARSRRVAE
jgi:hypothetical protein